jgi:large subunit ribosomal protein L9
MKIILNKDIDNLGKKGDVKEVKSGYARNYLLPNNLASIATASAIKKASADMKKLDEKEAKTQDEVKEQADSLKDKNITIKAKAEKNGKLFGAISEKEISENIKKQAGIEVDPKIIEISEPIKKVGEHKIKIKFTRKIGVGIEITIKSK